MIPHPPCIEQVDPRAVAAYGLGAAAEVYQRLGYAVIALRVGDKRPHQAFAAPPGSPPGCAGVNWATKDPRVIPHVWSSDRLAGVGIACGSVSGLVVVDLDIKSGENGIEEFRQFQIMASNVSVLDHYVPYDVQVATPSGGFHIWLRLPPGVSVPTRKGILPGVDIKADGGYVVAPPTQIWIDSSEGGRVLLPYRQVSGCPCTVPEAPPWFLKWVATAEGTGQTGGDSGYGEPLPDVEQLKETGLPGGSRNVDLHRLACRLFRHYGTDPGGVDAARRDIEAVLGRTDRHGFGRGEIERAITSALRFVQGCERTEEEGKADALRSGRWGATS